MNTDNNIKNPFHAQSYRHFLKYKKAASNIKRFPFNSNRRAFTKWVNEAKRQWALSIKYSEKAMELDAKLWAVKFFR